MWRIKQYILLLLLLPILEVNPSLALRTVPQEKSPTKLKKCLTLQMKDPVVISLYLLQCPLSHLYFASCLLSLTGKTIHPLLDKFVCASQSKEFTETEATTVENGVTNVNETKWEMFLQLIKSKSTKYSDTQQSEDTIFIGRQNSSVGKGSYSRTFNLQDPHRRREPPPNK